MKVQPPEKPSTDWSYGDPDYWDADALEREAAHRLDPLRQPGAGPQQRGHRNQPLP